MMTRLDPRLFPQDEARGFVSELFIHEAVPEERERIIAYIQALYDRFIAVGADGPWEAPLLGFLASQRENKAASGEPA